MQHSKSYLGAPKHRDLYDSLTKSYKLDKDLFESYGKPCSLKKDREDKDKEEDPSSAHAEEPSHTVDDSGAQQNQEFDTGNNDDQPAVEAALRDTWFKQPERPPTSNPKWNKSKHVDFRPPQTWISDTSRADKPRTSFDELMDTPIDFSAFIINQLNIINLTQKILVRQAFNLLKGTYKSHTELEYHFKECFKAITDRLDWNNPEGQEYPFDLSKPLPLVEVYRGRQVVPVNYFINNDLKYLKGESSSRTYTTSTIKTKAANYDISWIKDMVPSLWSPAKNTKLLSDIEDSHHGPSDAMHNPPQPFKVEKTLVSKLTEITLISIEFLTPRLLIFDDVPSPSARSIGICHAKPYTLRGGPSTKLGQRSDSQTHVLHLYWDFPAKIEIVMAKAL
ncbi:hypothetical protein Tco_1198760, partial [Tanacetum coccineum]